MADVVVAKYKADLKDYNAQIKKGTGQAEKDFNKVDESASGLSKTVGKLGAALAAAFAADKIISFTAEASKLAAEGEGIRKAFERVGDPKLLDGLRQATRGTVTDLELMKNAVKASNFKIPLQELAKLFEFARRRAKETGESVQFLVESITTGIGRKSPLILDNLGISAIELKKRLNGVSLEAASIGDIAQVVGAIATDEMQKMGAEAVTTKDRMDELSASWGNLTEKIGDAVNKSALFYADLLGIIDLNEGALTQAQAAANFITEERTSDLIKGYKDLGDVYTEITEKLGVLHQMQKELSDLGTSTNDRERRAELLIEIERQEGIVNALRDVFTAEQERQKLLKEGDPIAKEQIKNVAFWTAEIKRLQEELKNGDATIEENIATVNALTHAQEELNKILGKVKASSKAFNDTVDEEAKHNVEGMTGAVNDLVDALNLANDGFDAAAAVDFENQKQMDATDEFLESQRNAAKGTEQAWSDSFNATTEIATTFFNANQRREELGFQHQEELLARQLENQLISQEEYSQRLKGIQQQRAENAKQDAMFNAIINTAQSVTSALAAYDYASAILFGVLGAAEIGTIAAQPIPQFAKGTKEAPAGLKWVGEEGPELIYDDGGYPIITHKESMKILEKYNIPTVNFEKVETGGWGGLADSARLQSFNDRNILVAIDRHRTTDKEGFKYIAKELGKAMKVKRRGYA